jgi:trypsin-like peptidase
VDTSLKSIWLITNKHVLFGKEDYKRKQPKFPAAIEFYLRKIIQGKDAPIWDTIKVVGNDLVTLTKMHSDSLTDLVAINVTKYLLPLLLKKDSLYYYAAVSKLNFPKPDLMVGLNHGTTTGSEILAVGYPRKFYDTFNLFPTVKSGIIASKWMAKYDGQPFFLIDCKLFPGSSGSIVISNFTTYGGDKSFDWFEFLGVYSGEFIRQRETIEFEEMTITRKEDYNTGNVWYYYLIEEIIK